MADQGESPAMPEVDIARKLIETALDILQEERPDVQPQHVLIAFGRVLAGIYGHYFKPSPAHPTVDASFDEWVRIVRDEIHYHASGACGRQSMTRH